jgi:hypothetical protein
MGALTTPETTLDQEKLLPDCKGFVKVRLRYTTHKPLHVRSLILSTLYSIDGPYFEDVFVFVPQRETFPMVEAFYPIFNQLKKRGIIHETAQLKDFKIMDEDVLTLGYKLF